VARPQEERRQTVEGGAGRAEFRTPGETFAKSSSPRLVSDDEGEEGEWNVEEADTPAGDIEENTP
jgi:hypothetical protein